MRLKPRGMLEWAVFSCLLLIGVVGACSIPAVASRFFPKLFWSKQIAEVDRSIIFMTMSRDRTEQTLSCMQMLKDSRIDRQLFPYITEDGLEAAIRRIGAKQRRIEALEILYREKYERLKRLERQRLNENSTIDVGGGRQ